MFFALERVGPDGIPGLVEALKVDEEDLRVTVLERLQKYGAQSSAAVPELLKLLRHARADLRGAAASTLGAIGPEAEEAIPALRRLLNDTDPLVETSARRALARIKK